MEFKQSPFYIYENGKRKASLLLILFIIIQAFLILGAIIVAIWINYDNQRLSGDAALHENASRFTIRDLAAKAPFLSENDIRGIQEKTLKIINENTNSVNLSKTKAIIREQHFYSKTFDNGPAYINMVIDIPDLEQSYEVIYGSDSILGIDTPAIVLCLDDNDELIYENFECKSSDNDMFTRDAVVSLYLKYFNYNYFSVHFDPNNSNTITINPSVTYENDETTKNRYIDEVKRSIESLGISPEKYDYYVRTADDVDYRK